MATRRSKPLFVGELIPENRTRGQRAITPKRLAEQFRLTVACELIAQHLLTEPSLLVKVAINLTARQTKRSASSLEKLWEQNGADALESVARRLALKDHSVSDRYLKRLEERQARRRC